MSNMSLLEARERFGAISVALAAAPRPAAIATGFAELAPDQPASELIARADKELTESRHGIHDSRAQLTTDTSRSRRPPRPGF
jgi:hypothetical protein